MKQSGEISFVEFLDYFKGIAKVLKAKVQGI
jgi:hypothetical protein